MAYVTVTNSSYGQILGYDTQNTNNVTINLTPENLEVAVSALEGALTMAKTMQKAFGGTETTPAASSAGTSSGTTATTSGTVTSGGTAS